MTVITPEKRETILKLQEAVGRSAPRLRIVKNINRRESILELQKRLRIRQPTVSKAVARFETYGLIKFVGKKENSEVYDKSAMLKQIGSIDRWINVNLEESKEPVKPSEIAIKTKIPSAIPHLDAGVESDAQRMVEPFVILYLFENSLRNFVVRILTDVHGPNWWSRVVAKQDILNKVSGRQKLEGMNKWHVPRGSHEIFYTDLEDLTYFLRKEAVFQKYLDVDLWATTINKVVKLSRNIVDHHNPLPQREIGRLKQILEDWRLQLKL